MSTPTSNEQRTQAPTLYTLPSDWERGTWMQTFTGKQFYPLSAQPEDIDILDIAHALSMQCRYNGHTTQLYTVAQHCVLLSELVSPEVALWALLHDATEAYAGDMVRPLKQLLPEYQAIEDDLMKVIADKYGLDAQMPEEVCAADTRILLDERAALLSAPPADWEVEGEPFGITIRPWQPAEAKARYLARFRELTEGSGQADQSQPLGSPAIELNAPTRPQLVTRMSLQLDLVREHDAGMNTPDAYEPPYDYIIVDDAQLLAYTSVMPQDQALLEITLSESGLEDIDPDDLIRGLLDQLTDDDNDNDEQER